MASFVCSRPQTFALPYELTYSLVKVQYTVGDGLSIGQPCCAVHNCKVDLASKRDVYCPAHVHLEQQCAVTGCYFSHISPLRTCHIQEHQAVKRAYKSDKHRAIHQLCACLRSNGVAVPDCLEDESGQPDKGEAVLVIADNLSA